MRRRIIFILGIIGVLIGNFKMPIINIVIFSVLIIPIAIILGNNTTELSFYIGEKRSGLISATMGNIPEIMMGFWSVKLGMISFVKASMIGSIISNMLLVLGISVFMGGLKYKEQSFNKNIARTNFNMLILAFSTIIVMATLDSYSKINSSEFESLSIIVSIILIIIYCLGLIFSLYTHNNLFVIEGEIKSESSRTIKNKSMIIIDIVACTVLLYFISERLIVNLNSVIKIYGLSEEFIGILLVPILGNAGENVSAIMCAIKNKINMSLEIAIGSSMQIALFAIPLLVIFSGIYSLGMNLCFSIFHIIMIIIALATSFFVFQDGKTYWFEGAILLALYLTIIMAYYYLV
ncbi:calcium/proton exchanger [Clostridium sp. DL1XJH146]